jgi:hypothetical protein
MHGEVLFYIHGFIILYSVRQRYEVCITPFALMFVRLNVFKPIQVIILRVHGSGGCVGEVAVVL